MQKLTSHLSGELGETLALAKFISVGLHAYVSPPGAPGHDIIVVTPDGPKSVEVKTRQFVDRLSEITRWPVNMNTKAGADFFLFIELNLRSLEPKFYLLSQSQAKETHRNNKGGGSCVPTLVRTSVAPNDFSALTGEPPEGMPVPKPDPATSELRKTIDRQVEYGGRRIVQYTCQSIDVFVGDKLQSNAIENLREIAAKLDVSEYNDAGGVRNTRQLGKVVIDAIVGQKVL